LQGYDRRHAKIRQQVTLQVLFQSVCTTPSSTVPRAVPRAVSPVTRDVCWLAQFRLQSLLSAFRIFQGEAYQFLVRLYSEVIHGNACFLDAV